MNRRLIWYVFDAANAAKTIPVKSNGDPDPRGSNVKPGDIMPGIIVRSFDYGENLVVFHDGGCMCPLKVFSVEHSIPNIQKDGNTTYKQGTYFFPEDEFILAEE